MTISHITSLAELNKLIGKQGKLTVIDFHATWCGPCKMIAPTFEKLSKDYTSVNFVKVDVDQAQEVAQKYSVTAMPTFVFIKGSDVVHTIRGARSAELSSSVEKFSGDSVGASAFKGQGYKLGDGSKVGSTASDPRGPFSLGKELPIIAGLIGLYIFLMMYS
ncbi:hypothetical protein M408DRAFT_14813 [Serendipita vermifera MAFF 305830]|uniref:Thioredoxin domain-containing protein n=1 Tax=Serendipita vermifera MAFF 305830 TaxID=933852 RepID=A0A0C3BHD0_SERVB|nr:hypothetical protein M408DRAFT_14813 [Serendipita vermifera MAFF 305830]